MKKILAGVCLAAVLGVAVWRAPCTQWQCDRIVDRAVAEYGIEVPDTADYKAYVWQETQAQGLTARQLKAWFAADFADAPARKALNDARTADEFVNKLWPYCRKLTLSGTKIFSWVRGNLPRGRITLTHCSWTRRPLKRSWNASWTKGRQAGW